MRTPSRRDAPWIQVELQHVRLVLGERPVLRDINWRIAPGQRWVVLGANGAGKTQLLKLLAGDVWPTPGRSVRRWYRWRREQFDEPHGVKQEIAYLGAERQDRYHHYDWNHPVRAVIGTGLYRTDIPLHPLTRADCERVLRLLRRFGIETLASRRMLTLSYGQQRLVLLARALAWQPGLLLMDELLNGLDTANRQRVLKMVATISRSRRPWVCSTHRAEDIPPAATHLALLDQGRVIWQGALTSARRRQLQTAMQVARPRVMPRARATPHPRREAPLIHARNAWVWLEGRAVLRRLCFDIHAGQCWVVHGPNGSGKSTLIRALYGDLGVASQGQLRRRGIEPGVAIADFKRQVGLVAPELQTQHPLYLTALETVVSGLHSSIGLDAGPSAAERRRALRALNRLGAATLADRTLRALSYGQLRRVLFARAAVHEPDILLLDEPYTGLDPATRAVLRAGIDHAIIDGRTVVMTTHHADEWPQRATHELQLDQGRAVYAGAIRNLATRGSGS
jgi:molybdate transport system ATP-binding protein